jgi:glucose/arabinose dehydrogenase
MVSCVFSFSLLSWLAATGEAQVHGSATPLTTVAAFGGFQRPVLACAPGGDTTRLFVLEQWTGRIRIVTAGSILPTPFLDLGGHITVGDDLGMRSLAFHPQYASNGCFFVSYIDRLGDLVLSRFHVSSDPNVADPRSEEILLTIDEPGTNHSGGMIAFGPNDGYLYMATGDGGPGNDPDDRAQDPSLLLGKILRLDIDVPEGYGIPPDNPFVGPGDPRDEIWALGLRHPWRFSFDRVTGDLYLGDVGQSSVEEIDFQPAHSAGGQNYGWRCMEGTRCTGMTGCVCGSPALTEPIYQFDHDAGCAVIGGYVYRGCAVPDLRGTYFFADYCTAKIYSLLYDGSGVIDLQDRTGELTPGSGGPIQSPFSFGEDGLGELYILDGAKGVLWKIVPREPVTRASSYGVGWPGTHGVPAISSRDPLKPCGTIDIDIENSCGKDTRGYLFFGVSRAFTQSDLGGTLLLAPRVIRGVKLPAKGLVFPLAVPCDVALCQISAYLQAIEQDPGASLGFSFTPGLELSIGDS